MRHPRPYRLATEHDGGECSPYGDPVATLATARRQARAHARNLIAPRETAILIMDAAGEIVDSFARPAPRAANDPREDHVAYANLHARARADVAESCPAGTCESERAAWDCGYTDAAFGRPYQCGGADYDAGFDAGAADHADESGE